MLIGYALFGHEVLVQVDSTCPLVCSSCVSISLLSDRPLVQIARLEELISRGESVLLHLLFSLCGSRVLTITHARERLHLNVIIRTVLFIWHAGALTCAVSHLIDVGPELL